jgi:hypothetical protein
MSQKAAAAIRAGQSDTQLHQPGQDAFKAILSDDVDWKPFPAFPPSVRLAVVVGQPSEPSPYLIRVKVPRGVKLMPHRHPQGPDLHGHIRRLLYRPWRRIRRQQTAGVSARCGDRAAFEYTALPLGEVRRVRHTSDSDRTAGAGIRQRQRRSAKQQLRGLKGQDERSTEE